MRTNLTIYELKILKGPDRLLRMKVLISDTIDMEIELLMLASLVEALLFKHHNLSIDFPTNELLAIIPKGAGEFFKGKIGLEMFFRYKEPSVFNLRHYSEALEIERILSSAESTILVNKIDYENYQYKYSLNDFRNGETLFPVIKKLNYFKI